MMPVFEVEVTHTDRSRTADGRFVEYRTRIEVLADTATDATLAAAQVAGAIRGDGMVLSANIVL